MNILVDIRPLLDERYSGVAEYTLELLKALLQIDTENQYFLFYNSFHNLEYRLPVFPQSNVKVIKTRLPNKLLNYPLLRILQRPYLDRLADTKIDLFFMPHLNFAAWSRQTKMILTVHDLSFVYYPKFFSLRKNMWHRLLAVKSLIRRAYHIVSLSENTKQDIVSYGQVLQEKVSVIYSGISSTFSKLLNDDSRLQTIKEKYQLPDRFLLFLGTVEPRKNLPTLFEAFSMIKQQPGYEDLELVVAGGTGWKAQPIYRQAEASPYRSSIKFLDYIPAEEKVYLYNLATIFVYPSFYEGFGFPPLEAMACGTPTIVSAASSLPEVVENAALMIDPYNARSIFTALHQLLEDRALYDHFSQAGQVQAAKFSWAKVAEQYLQLFKRLN